MNNKNTDWLEHELSDAKNIEDYLSENKSQLRQQTLSEHLEWLLKEKGLSKAQVIEKSGLDKVYAYHILNCTPFFGQGKLCCITKFKPILYGT